MRVATFVRSVTRARLARPHRSLARVDDMEPPWARRAESAAVRVSRGISATGGVSATRLTFAVSLAAQRPEPTCCQIAICDGKQRSDSHVLRRVRSQPLDDTTRTSVAPANLLVLSVPRGNTCHLKERRALAIALPVRQQQFSTPPLPMRVCALAQQCPVCSSCRSTSTRRGQDPVLRLRCRQVSG